MYELKRQILQIMRKMEEDGLNDCSMEEVARKLNKDFNDSLFQTALEELVGDGTIRFIDTVSAKLVI